MCMLTHMDALSFAKNHPSVKVRVAVGTCKEPILYVFGFIGKILANFRGKQQSNFFCFAMLLNDIHRSKSRLMSSTFFDSA